MNVTRQESTRQSGGTARKGPKTGAEGAGPPSPAERFTALLPEVRTPGQYTGGEWNALSKPFEKTPLRVALAFPDTYSVGMSSLGFSLIQALFQRRADTLAERFFTPESDMDAALRREGLPLLSLESRRPLAAFDLVAFSLAYGLLLTNAMAMLDLGGLAPLAGARREADPLVVAGGSGVLSPEVVAPFFDLLLLGDGEAIVDPLSDALLELRGSTASKREKMSILARNVPGAYAPALYERRPSHSGFLIPHPRPGSGAPEKIRPALVEDLDSAFLPLEPLVPNVEVTHDRISVEIMRGCPHGCRFCEAGFTRNPIRIRAPETVLRASESLLAATGHEEISFLSLSVGDYPGLSDLIREAHRRFGNRGVSVSLPSLRVDPSAAQLPSLLGAVRKSGLTLAPETGNRLRPMLNKTVRDEDLLASARHAWSHGWRLIKLYFMVGFPGEGREDHEAIARLADRVARLRGEVAPSAGRVNVTVSPFVPRPHTPLQWEAQADPETVRGAFDRIQAGRRIKSVRFKFHSPERAVLEGLLARGDEIVARAVHRAFQGGARFDAWDERFDPRLWAEAFSAEGVDPARYLFQPRDPDEATPWDVAGAGPPRSVLREEREKALRGEPTPSCEQDHCAGSCGKNTRFCCWGKDEA
ncbi:MAG: TIGR03960 family B12-binding radical SAM protein [Planctomycetota bacterium]|jgi:radical SAM family uncharacterized protein